MPDVDINSRPPPPRYGRGSRTVAFRVTEDEEALLEELRDSMPGRKMSDALRWLLTNPETKQAIMAQINGSRHE